MSDFIVSLLADMAEGAITGAAKRRPRPVHAQPWSPPEIAPPAAAPQPAPEPQRPVRAAPPSPAAKPAPVPSPDRLGIRRLFASRTDILHTVIAAEVLAPPPALRDDNLLRRPGV